MFWKAIVLLTSLLASVVANATAQSPDVLIIEGKSFRLYTNPLHEYLQSMNWSPPEEAQIWSSNWRGYIATWEIDDAQLFLKDVTIRIEDPSNPDDEVKKSILHDIFGDTSPITAYWYSGALIIPDGELKQYVHMGYGSSYDHYQVIRIHFGRVVEHLSMTDREFDSYREKKFDAFAKTDEFRKAYADLRNESDDLTESELIEFMKSFYAESYLSQ